MIYFMAMKRLDLSVIKVIFPIILLAATAGEAYPQDHIRELGAVREAMSQVGSKLPDLIKKSDPKYLRTLERVFEINNYALVTIESYMKMVKVAISSGGTINKDIVTVLNGWLGFIKHYCEYDVKYFDEALAETKDDSIVSILKKEKDNISKLMSVSEKGIAENVKLSKKP
jgi:hypothetical protein